MNLKDLVGTHQLSGVDRETSKVKVWDELYEDCDVIRFVLDGITYTAIEDPEDGYRSSMKEIVADNSQIKNSFLKVEVNARMKPDDDYDKNDVLELFDAKNGKLVLTVGTAMYDDYYPYWVAEFIPENMCINDESD